MLPPKALTELKLEVHRSLGCDVQHKSFHKFSSVDVL